MKIFLLTNTNFVGDNNQLKGIQLAIQTKLKEQCEFQQIEESEFDVNSLGEKDIVLVSGSHGLIIADQIKQSKPGTKIVWSGHQYFDEFNSIKYFPDIVALPGTALLEIDKTEIKKRAKLIVTAGVSHCVNDQTVTEDHAKFKGDLPEHAQYPKQVGIILAGDAPTAEGKMMFFTEENARKQAVIISSRLKAKGYDTTDTAIMITNGPRTGKHNPDTGNVHNPEPHRSGEVDASSKAFLDAINEEMSQSQVFFYDFQFADLKNGPSAYKPMIKQVADSQTGLWFVPSESTSMVTESSFFLEKGIPVVIYHPSSENPAHLAHAKDAVNQRFAVDVANEVISFEISKGKMESAATKIAEAFYQALVLTKIPKVSSVNSTMYSTAAKSDAESFEPTQQVCKCK
ncbi:hypothetical protein FOG18_02115 [Legionella israelensis]|uniref:hypothetical protein n=1 Tax=Legionella israelensis TaxID=454 RepID=UPI00117BE7DC|nr:hypothetical protein [Legionella israelensis]QDP71455.1 hypothetical protein FOG18_02115 [Legionella israelensis]